QRSPSEEDRVSDRVFGHLFHMQIPRPLPRNEVFTSYSHADVNQWRRQGAQCCQIENGVSYQRHKMIAFGGSFSYLATLGRRSTNDSSLYSQSSRKKVERKGHTLS